MITEEHEANIAMYMRVIEFCRKHEDLLNKKPEIKKEYANLKNSVQKLFEQLSEEDKDQVLERYKDDMEYMQSQPKFSDKKVRGLVLACCRPTQTYYAIFFPKILLKIFQ